MSGEKCVTVSLQEQHRHRIAAAHQRARRVADICAEASKEAGQAKAEIERLKDHIEEKGNEVEKIMPKEKAKFAALRQEFDRAFAEFEESLEDAHGKASALLSVGLSGDNQQAAEEASDMVSQVEKALGGLQLEPLVKLRDDLRDCAESIEKDLSSERSKALHEQWRQDRLRAIVEGLRAEMHERWNGSVPLAWVKDKAQDWWQKTENLLSDATAKIDESQVAALKSDLADLVEQSAELDRKHKERVFVAEKINQVFRNAGFGFVDSTEDTWIHENEVNAADITQTFISHYERRAQQTQVQSRVPHQGEIVFSMHGPEGSQSATMVPARHCDVDLERIIEEARKLGIDITAISIKNPDGTFDCMKITNTLENRQKPKVVERAL